MRFRKHPVRLSQNIPNALLPYTADRTAAGQGICEVQAIGGCIAARQTSPACLPVSPLFRDHDDNGGVNRIHRRSFAQGFGGPLP